MLFIGPRTIPDSDGFHSTARLLAPYLCYCGSSRSRRKCVPCSPIVKAAPVLACDHPLSVVDGGTFTVMGRIAGLLPSRTPLRSSVTTATAQLSLTCRVRVRLSSASPNIVSMSRGRTSSTPLFGSSNRTDHVCTSSTYRSASPSVGSLNRVYSTARSPVSANVGLPNSANSTMGGPQAQVYPRERFRPLARFRPRARFRFRSLGRSRRLHRLARKMVVRSKAQDLS